MRGIIAAVFACTVGLAIGAAGLSSAVVIPLPPVSTVVAVRVSPRSLPRNQTVPISLEISGSVSAREGGHAPALRTMAIRTSGGIELDGIGLPSCDAAKLAAEPAETGSPTSCKGARVGGGSAVVEDVGVSRHRVALAAFNGGARGTRTTILVRATLDGTHPSPVATIKVVRRGGTDPILRVTAMVPRFLEGRGSLVGLRLNLQRKFKVAGERHSFVRASCPDGQLRSDFEADFADEVGTGIGDQEIFGSSFLKCAAR